jgi:CheY-like chemotaxis protein
VLRASNGVEALALMHQNEASAQPYVVLMDINMPFKDGLETLGEFRTDDNIQNAIVFMLTSSPLEEDKRQAYQFNVAGYFLKNNINDLLDVLNAYSRSNQFPTK